MCAATFGMLHTSSEGFTRVSPRAFLASSLSMPSSPNRSLRSLLTTPLNDGSLRSLLICSNVLMSSSSRLTLTLTPLGLGPSAWNWGFLPGLELCIRHILAHCLVMLEKEKAHSAYSHLETSCWVSRTSQNSFRRRKPATSFPDCRHYLKDCSDRRACLLPEIDGFDE